MRELAHIFNLSKSTVHAVVMRVLDALQELKPKVSSSLKFKKYSCLSVASEAIEMGGGWARLIKKIMTTPPPLPPGSDAYEHKGTCDK